MEPSPTEPNLRPLRPPRQFKYCSPLHHDRTRSLNKLIQMKMLPPLHPQTDHKLQARTHTRYADENEETDAVSSPKSRKLQESDVKSTAAFGFSPSPSPAPSDNSPICMSPSLELSDPTTSLELTFGRQILPSQPLQNKSEFHNRKASVPGEEPLKSRAIVFKLGRYDSIYQPIRPRKKATEPLVAE